MESKPKLDEIESAASAWLVKRDRPDWSADDESNLNQWLRASPSHRVSYIRQLSIWRDADRLKSLSPGLPKGQVPPRGTIEQSPFFTIRRKHIEGEEIPGEALDEADDPVMETPPVMALSQANENDVAASTANATSLLDTSAVSRNVQRSRTKRYAIAAMTLIGIGTALVTYTTGFLSRGKVFTTPVGGLSTVPTADGSSITLNTDTEIKVQLSQSERRIELKRGEAFFDVAKDPARSFVVYVHNQRVIAIGTQFSVRLNSDAVQVAVTEGKVRFEEEPSLLARLTVSKPDTAQSIDHRSDPDAHLAVAGSIADIRGRHISVKQSPMAEIEQSLSWRSGYVVLDRTPLPEAVAEFNRYNTRRLAIEDPTLADIKVGGNFRATNVDGFVRLVERAFGVEAREKDGTISLTRKR